MLYDPKWDVQNKPVFRDFIEWLKIQDPKEYYDWSDASNCACAQFYRERGEFAPDWIVTNRKVREAESIDINMLASNHGVHSGWTFGALLQRCQEALAT